MTTIAKLNYERKQAGLPLIRFNLLRLNPEDVQDLRDAYAAAYEISEAAVGDRRGYYALARGHGYDQDLCHNDDRIFLTWHRSYIYAFEKMLNSALQAKRGDDELELTLPYWDWTEFDPATHAPDGIPKIVDEPTYQNASGGTVENPLARAKSLYRVVSQGLTGDDAYTHRFPAQLRANIPVLENEVDRYLTNPNFSSFQADFNFGAHGTVHVVVGGADSSSPLPGGSGDMASVVSAAFDPIFWLHHGMVDKVWFDWQGRHPGVSIPQHVLDTPVYGGRPGRDFLDAEHGLRYIYSSDSVESAIVAPGTVDSVAASGLSAQAVPAKEVPLGGVASGFVRAQLDFHRLRPPKGSYEIRAYVENPHCDATTGYEDESYAGRLVLFGHGQCHGAPGHCNPDLAKRDDYDIRPKHPLRYEHTKYCLDITRGLRRYLTREKSPDGVKVYLVTVDAKGEGVPAESVKYEGCSLRTFA